MKIKTTKDIGTLIKQARKKLNLTQETLVQLSNVGTSR